MSLSGAGTKKIKDYFSETYHIPNYQREYSWETAELEDFWDDLVETAESSDISDHFFGQILVHHDESAKKRYIIDGQQRSITSVIFLSALNKHLEKIYASDNSIDDANLDASEIKLNIIGRKDKYKLILGELDKDYFVDNIQSGSPTKDTPIKKSHKRIKGAYRFFDTKLTNYQKDADSIMKKYEHLHSLYDTFTEHFIVLYLEETKLEQAFVIFETLNARGKSLETADLLKNYFFSKAPAHIESSQRKWDNMVRSLGNEEATKYIRHYWNSRHSLTREKELYRTINKNITTTKESRDLLDDLASLAVLYHDIADPTEATVLSSKKLLSSLSVLKDLKARSFYPVFLALKSSEKFSEEDYGEIAAVIESYVFRNSTICGKTANAAEKFFSSLANDIYGQNLETVEEICATISENIVSDEQFEAEFSSISFSETSKSTVRYIFRKMHKFKDPASELNIDNMEVHIEHIMPEENSKWNVDEDIHKQYLWRLGNLMLLKGKINISIHNDVFDVKKEEYKKSKIEPNKEILQYTEWTPVEIEDRQRTLASYALHIWPKA